MDKFREMLAQQMQVYKKIGMKEPLEYTDEISKIVIPKVKTIQFSKYPKMKIVEEQSAIRTSIEMLSVLNPELISRVQATISTTPLLRYFPGTNQFTSHISCSLDDTTMELDPNSLKIEHYKVGQYMDELSPVYLAHEHIHSLKDTFLPEYQSRIRASEIIPLFFEMVCIEKQTPTIRKAWFQSRISALQDNLREIDYIKRVPNLTQEEYEFVKYNHLQYITSFYYANILYNMYLLNKKEMLLEIEKVLNRQITTEQLLINLGILEPTPFLNDTFDKNFRITKSKSK